MGRNIFRQETQIRASDTYDDTIAPTEAAYETNPANIEVDLNNIRSMMHTLLKNRAGNWWDDLNTPTALDTGTKRGVNDLNTDLHANERKRILGRVAVLGAGVGPVATNAQHAVLDAAGELPGNTTMAVGAVTTLGTVCAQATTFDTASASDEVAGGDALRPKNLCILTDTTTGDALETTDGRQIYGLMQSESGTDGHTASVTTPNRLQISFVVRNSGNDNLELAAQGEMDGVSFDYSATEREAFEDLPEHWWLGDNFVDQGAANVTREGAYTNQGATPVDITANAILDIEGAGLVWKIRDDNEADLFAITENSATSATDLTVGAAVDTYQNKAVDVDFDNGITVDETGTAINIGVTTAQIDAAASLAIKATGASSDLLLEAGREVLFDDANLGGSAWSGTSIQLSDTVAEWTTFISNFGDGTSLIDAINQAYSSSVVRTIVWSVVTADAAADADLSGPANDNNLDTDLGSLATGTFTTDYDFFWNGQILRPGADAAANHDIYPGTSLANGQIKLEFKAKIGDQLLVIKYV